MSEPRAFADGRYVLRRVLGEGGMGVVYEAWDRDRKCAVALKTLRRVEPAALYRFKREFRAAADLSHRNLVALHELVAEGERLYFTMELVEGVDFLRHVGRRTWPGAATETGTPGALPEPTPIHPDDDSDRTAPRALRGPVRLGVGDDTGTVDPDKLRDAMRQLAAGVHALHGAGLLHRDLKPSNVLVTAEGRVVLLDFGLVTYSSPTEASVERYVAGTAAYMSPEQAAAKPLSEAADWYAMGVMLYEALTGVRPFRGSWEDVLRDKQTLDPVAPASFLDVPADLSDLCVELLRRDPASRPGGAELLARLGDVAPLPIAAPTRLVGREVPLAALSVALAAVGEGSPRIVHVHGPSGVGKTALLRRFHEDAVRAQALVLSGRCYERESVPFKGVDAVIDALSRYLRSLPTDRVDALLPRDVHAAARLFPVLRQIEAIALARAKAQEPQDPIESRRRAGAALRELFARLADRRPLVVVLDDLQWADRDSAQLLIELLRGDEPPPWLLVVSYRDAHDAPPIVALRASCGLDGAAPVLRAEVVDLPIGPLLAGAARTLAEELLGDAATATQIAADALGSPFLLHELARWVREHRAAPRDAAGPVRLQSMLEARIGRLSEDVRDLLEVVAVAARPLRASSARRALADLPIDERARTLREEHLLRVGGVSDEAVLECAHDRIREAVIAAIPQWRLRERHLRLALALDGPDADAEALAAHWSGAGHLDRAAEQAERAAARAVDALAFDRAAMLFRMTLHLRSRSAAEDRPLRVGLGDALAHAGRGEEASEAYLLATAGAEPATASELRRRAAEQLVRSGHFERGMALLGELMADLSLGAGPSARWALAGLAMRRSQVALRGLRWHERAAAEVPATERLRIDVAATAAAGLAMVDPIRGADFQARALLLALRAGEPGRVARALAMEAAYHSTSGRKGRDRAARLLAEASGLAARLDDAEAEALVLSVRGIAAFEGGRWQEARDALQQALAVYAGRCTGVAWEIATSRHFLLLALEMTADWGRLSRAVPDWIREAEDRGDRFAASSFRSGNLNVAWLIRDDVGGARQAVRQALALWGKEALADGGALPGADPAPLQTYEALYALASIDLYTGDGAAARGRVAPIEACLRGSGLRHIEQLRVEATYLLGRCELAAACAEPALARSLRPRLGDRARSIVRSPAPWGRPLASLLLAGAEALDGDREAASRFLAAAEADAAQLGARVFAWVASARGLELAGAAPPEAPDAAGARPDRLADLYLPFPRVPR